MPGHIKHSINTTIYSNAAVEYHNIVYDLEVEGWYRLYMPSIKKTAHNRARVMIVMGLHSWSKEVAYYVQCHASEFCFCDTIKRQTTTEDTSMISEIIYHIHIPQLCLLLPLCQEKGYYHEHEQRHGLRAAS